jgi:TM2 domain-containing membrane protein YozV
MQPNQRTTAGLVALLLGIFGLGWIGIHKFMMGYKSTGILWIVISLVTCFIGGAVLSVISIVEGIIYLTMTDEQWYQTYIMGRKEWF